MSEPVDLGALSALSPDEEEAIGQRVIEHAALRRRVAALEALRAAQDREVADLTRQRDAARLALALGGHGMEA